MTPRGWIIVALIVIVAVWVCLALLRSPASPPMRTADQRQIDRETAEIQRNSRSLAAQERAGCDVYELRNVHSLCKERARRDARHQARMEDLKGRPPVNPYPPNDSGFVYWAIELAEARTEIYHANHPIQNINVT